MIKKYAILGIRKVYEPEDGNWIKWEDIPPEIQQALGGEITDITFRQITSYKSVHGEGTEKITIWYKPREKE